MAKLQTLTRDPTEFQAGLPQALMFMNGEQVSAATSAKESGMLQSIEAPFFSNEQRLEILFLATLGRKPTPQERSSMLPYIDEEETSNRRTSAFADILWAVLNSTEFATNH